MNQATATVIAAVVALVGVLAGAVIGVLRWKRERRDARAADFTRDRQAAYRSLWSNIEGMSVALRTDRLDSEGIRKRVREVNAELMKAGLYLDEPDRDLASSYLAALERFHAAVASSDEPEARKAFNDTGVIPQHAIRKVQDLGTAQDRVAEL